MTDTVTALELLSERLRAHSEGLLQLASHGSSATSEERPSTVLSSLSELQAATADTDELVQSELKGMSQRLSTLKAYTRLLATHYPDFAPTLQHVLSTPKRTASSAPHAGSASPQTPSTRSAAGLCSPLTLPRTPLNAAASPTTGSEHSPTSLLRSPTAIPANAPQTDASLCCCAAHTAQTMCCGGGTADFIASLAPCTAQARRHARPARGSGTLTRQFLTCVDELVCAQLKADGVRVTVPGTTTHPSPTSADNHTREDGDVPQSVTSAPSGAPLSVAALGEALLVDIREGLLAPLSASTDALADPVMGLRGLFPHFHAFSAALIAQTDEASSSTPSEAQMTPNGRRRRSRYGDGIAEAPSHDHHVTPVHAHVLQTKVLLSREMARIRLDMLHDSLFAVVALRHVAWLLREATAAEPDSLTNGTIAMMVMHKASAYVATTQQSALSNRADARPPTKGFSAQTDTVDPLKTQSPTSAPSLISLKDVYTMIGYTPLWCNSGPLHAPDGHAGSAVVDDGYHRDVDRSLTFVQTVAPFLALWCDGSARTQDASMAPPRVVWPSTRQDHGTREALVLPASLAPTAWRETTCDYLQACVREACSSLHDLSVARAASLSGQALTPSLGAWLAARDASDDAMACPPPPYPGLATAVYPASRRFLDALSLVDARGMLLSEEVEEESSEKEEELDFSRSAVPMDILLDEDELAEHQEAEQNSPNGSQSTAVGVANSSGSMTQAAATAGRALNASATSSQHATLGFSLPPPAAGSSLPVSMSSSSTFVGSSATARSVPASQDRTSAMPSVSRINFRDFMQLFQPQRPPARQGYVPHIAVSVGAVRAEDAESTTDEAPPATEAVVVELPHISTVLREEAAHGRRSCYGRALQDGVGRRVQTTVSHHKNNADTQLADLDTLLTTASFDGVYSAVVLPRFHSTFLFCPVSRQRCVDPLVGGGVLKSDTIAYRELQGLPRVDRSGAQPGANSPREGFTDLCNPLGPLEVAMATLQMPHTVGVDRTVASATRNLLDFDSIYRTGSPIAPVVPLNPPDLLECGHILSHRTVQNLLTAPLRQRHPTQRVQSLRCPYCSHDTTSSRIITLSYLSN